MDTSFFQYLRHLELIGFFSGYPLLFVIVIFFSGNKHVKKIIAEKSKQLLPFSYAVVGFLFLGMELRNLYPDYSYDNIVSSVHVPFLTVWGLMSILFLIPFLRKNPILSLLHSLVFFILLAKNSIQVLDTTNGDQSQLKNYISVYSDSLILNFSIYVLMLLLLCLLLFLRKKNLKN